jgi:hypothetical protein
VVVSAPAVAPAYEVPVTPADPVLLAIDRLSSFHANSRRDGALTLGRLGDPRAVPYLIQTLKTDSSRDVRIAAAIALGEIGGLDASTALERCIVYDKKQPVRDAAASALRDLQIREAEAQAAAHQAAASSASSSSISAPRPPVNSTVTAPFANRSPVRSASPAQRANNSRRQGSVVSQPEAIPLEQAQGDDSPPRLTGPDFESEVDPFEEESDESAGRTPPPPPTPVNVTP